MDKALLDTDIFSEVLKGVDREVASKASHYRTQFGRYSISTVTIVEIVKGLHKLQREDRVKQFLAGLADVEILSLDLGSSELAGRMYAEPGAHRPAHWARGPNDSGNCAEEWLGSGERECLSLPAHPNAGLRAEARKLAGGSVIVS